MSQVEVEAPVLWLLFHPKGVPGDAIASATADRSEVSEVQFSFRIECGTIVLHTNPLEMPDPWAVRPIQFFPELVCVHHPLVLIWIRSTDNCYSTLFFIYRFLKGNGASASDTVAELPKVASEIWASQSFGLVYDGPDCGTYVVANLQREYNQVTKQVEVFLHRWWYSGSSWESKVNVKVTLPSGINIDMGKWQCDQVITYKDALLWADLSQGVILRCKNPLQKCKANFDFICLPCMRVPRPQTFMSVGCCKDELKLVKINYTSDVDTVYVTIMTFNEQSYQRCLNKRRFWKYWNTNSGNSNPLVCRDLWAVMKNKSALQLSHLEASGNHMPCFPVLNTYNDNILHLTMVRKDNKGAWLLQVNTQSWDLEDAAAYPRFRNQQKPPYSSYFRID